MHGLFCQDYGANDGYIIKTSSLGVKFLNFCLDNEQISYLGKFALSLQIGRFRLHESHSEMGVLEHIYS